MLPIEFLTNIRSITLTTLNTEKYKEDIIIDVTDNRIDSPLNMEQYKEDITIDVTDNRIDSP